MKNSNNSRCSNSHCVLKRIIRWSPLNGISLMLVLDSDNSIGKILIVLFNEPKNQLTFCFEIGIGYSLAHADSWGDVFGGRALVRLVNYQVKRGL